MKLRLEDVPSMDRATVIAWAASRYGLRRPTPDQILTRRFPDYETSRSDVIGYHEYNVEIDKLVLSSVHPPRCKACGGTIPAGEHRNRRYCCGECINNAETAKVAGRRGDGVKECITCGTEYRRRANESNPRWDERKYCRACAKHRPATKDAKYRNSELFASVIHDGQGNA